MSTDPPTLSAYVPVPVGTGTGWWAQAGAEFLLLSYELTSTQEDEGRPVSQFHDDSSNGDDWVAHHVAATVKDSRHRTGVREHTLAAT